MERRRSASAGLLWTREMHPSIPRTRDIMMAMMMGRRAGDPQPGGHGPFDLVGEVGGQEERAGCDGDLERLREEPCCRQVCDHHTRPELLFKFPHCFRCCCCCCCCCLKFCTLISKKISSGSNVGVSKNSVFSSQTMDEAVR